MCRSDPHTPLASMRTIASRGSLSCGSGTSETSTSRGAWKVTARIFCAHPRGRLATGASWRGRGRMLARMAEPSKAPQPTQVPAPRSRADEPSKAVLISGCSSGIGRATALRLAGAGWTVYASARRPQSIADLAAAGCRTLALDVTDESSMRAAVDAVERDCGAVGVLINNAGYSQSGALETVSPEAARRQFETNVF